LVGKRFRAGRAHRRCRQYSNTQNKVQRVPQPR
jgi:hypothetical protein